MKAGKKLLALLLTVCMLLCMLPTVAFASGSRHAEKDGSPARQALQALHERAIASASVGWASAGMS